LVIEIFEVGIALIVTVGVILHIATACLGPKKERND